jgi:hypothetical protein
MITRTVIILTEKVPLRDGIPFVFFYLNIMLTLLAYTTRRRFRTRFVLVFTKDITRSDNNVNSWCDLIRYFDAVPREIVEDES